jgi:hypothetical protein
MQRALDSLTGLPNRSTSASWMLVFLMPADVSRSFKPPPVWMSGEKTPPASENHRGSGMGRAFENKNPA